MSTDPGILGEAIENAQQDQIPMLNQAIELTERMAALFHHTPLGPTASHCLAAYNLFIEIITPFIHPFQFTKDELVAKMHDHDAKMALFASFFVHDTIN